MATLEQIQQRCEHAEQATRIDEVSPTSPDSCLACVERGDTWVHLRECAQCGNVGCCDSSKNRHARAHNRESGHPVVRSYEPGEAWWFCYPDEFLFELDGVDAARNT